MTMASPPVAKALIHSNSPIVTDRERCVIIGGVRRATAGACLMYIKIHFES
jgi:hypothetical protein